VLAAVPTVKPMWTGPRNQSYDFWMCIYVQLQLQRFSTWASVSVCFKAEEQFFFKTH
jgi:hypothetical protein